MVIGGQTISNLVDMDNGHRQGLHIMSCVDKQTTVAAETLGFLDQSKKSILTLKSLKIQSKFVFVFMRSGSNV